MDRHTWAACLRNILGKSLLRDMIFIILTLSRLQACLSGFSRIHVTITGCFVGH